MGGGSQEGNGGGMRTNQAWERLQLSPTSHVHSSPPSMCTSNTILATTAAFPATSPPSSPPFIPPYPYRSQHLPRALFGLGAPGSLQVRQAVAHQPPAGGEGGRTNQLL